MILVVQRVTRACVRVPGPSGPETVGAIDRGLCVLAGVLAGDSPEEIDWLADKLAGLRVFEDAQGRTNLGLEQVAGAVLLVPQFTLAADWRRGRRPAFTRAAPPDEATAGLARFAARLRSGGLAVAEGRFGAAMAVEIHNDGPFTLVLDSRERTASAPESPPAATDRT